MATRSRRPLYMLSSFGVTQILRQHPYMIAWWSAVFPGFGHFMLNQYIRGALLTLSEVVINSLARINESMVYSFCGQFQQARDVLHPNWIYGYIAIYIFSIWDSYRSSLYVNKLSHLGELENEAMVSVRITPLELQYLEQRSPFSGVVASFFFPGLGQLYNQRFGLAFYGILWWWIYSWLSQCYVSVLYLLLGRLQDSIQVLHPHWLLFMPSVLGGSMYHAYETAIAHNRLYRLEQRQFLTERYSLSEVRIFP
ncbi:hypothetical protein [Paenibacillus koleovorans]|uniref:hypothetical protein n=1 Tax=Paenibacillus koleovorans TaxID=121608 RepID=UPI000FD869C1|nr:hypothetical protein [Paenibacillus koleovorans]